MTPNQRLRIIATGSDLNAINARAELMRQAEAKHEQAQLRKAQQERVLELRKQRLERCL